MSDRLGIWKNYDLGESRLDICVFTGAVFLTLSASKANSRVFGGRGGVLPFTAPPSPSSLSLTPPAAGRSAAI